ncbi:MAG: hypothetical protein JNN15_05090 [Blastocatellia bacterium]|nr:hypothetical protein [Blastocatellia bacterium]
MDNGSIVKPFIAIVALLGLVSVVLSVLSPNYPLAIFVVLVSVGIIAILLTAQKILAGIAETRESLESFSRESRVSIPLSATVPNANISETSPQASKQLLDSAVGVSSSAKTTDNVETSAPATFSKQETPGAEAALDKNDYADLFTPPASVTRPQPSKKAARKNYKTFSGLQLSGEGFAPVSSSIAPTTKLPPVSDSKQDSTGVGVASKPSEIEEQDVEFERTLDQTSQMRTAAPPHIALQRTDAFASLSTEEEAVEATEDIGVTTQSFLPSELQGRGSGHTPGEAPLATNGAVKVGEEKQTPKSKASRRRYSTFAGLPLTEDPNLLPPRDPMQNFAPPQPPPPPVVKQKERKRYSTFAGLPLGDKSGMPPLTKNLGTPSLPQPSTLQLPKSEPVTAPTSLSSTSSLGSGSSAQTAGLSKEPSLPTGVTKSSSAISSQPTKPDQPALERPAEQKKKRYQTFMGLSLSKTPPSLKQLEDPLDRVDPPPTPSGAYGAAASPTYGQPKPAPPPPPSLQATLNKGQTGNLVDGFCSLCGSPQAASNLEDTLSTPEFCWYCGGKLRM